MSELLTAASGELWLVGAFPRAGVASCGFVMRFCEVVLWCLGENTVEKLTGVTFFRQGFSSCLLAWGCHLRLQCFVLVLFDWLIVVFVINAKGIVQLQKSSNPSRAKNLVFWGFSVVGQRKRVDTIATEVLLNTL